MERADFTPFNHEENDMPKKAPRFQWLGKKQADGTFRKVVPARRSGLTWWECPVGHRFQASYDGVWDIMQCHQHAPEGQVGVRRRRAA